MPKGFQTPITIKEAIDKIDENKYVLPGIQRRFVWGKNQIELLFDSIMRDYPFNSLMLWEINSPQIKNNYNYYSFLRKYKQRFEVENEMINKTASDDDFFAIIDGQQRLNSLYLGLKGSYTMKKPHRPWVDKSDYFEEQFLYLDITSEYQSESDIDRAYNFRFLPKSEAENSKDIAWYKVGDILQINPDDIFEEISDFVEQQLNIRDKKYARNTLNKLNKVIREDKILNYYLETEQDLDKVLDIFIRTNDGGTKLTFSDLLMSVLTTHWKESRDEFDELIKDVRSFGDFNISSDLIIKSILERIIETVSNLNQSPNKRLHKSVANLRDKIAEWNKREKAASYPYFDSRHRYNDLKEPKFVKNISVNSLPRLYRFLDTLVTVIERIGDNVTSNWDIQIDKDIVRVEVIESTDKVSHELTKEEAKELAEYNDSVKFKGYAFKPRIKKYDYIPNGKFRFKIIDGKYIKDTKEFTLEQSIPEIIVLIYQE